MNMTDVINDIKITNGLNTIALPFDKPIEIVIQEILQTSIRTFSQFKPYVREVIALRSTLRSPSEYHKKQSIYYLPEQCTITPVMYADAYVASAETPDGVVTTNAFTVGSPFVGFGSYLPQDIINATMTGAAINKFAGITSRQPTSKWLGYNKIQLFDFPDEIYIKFVVKCNHDPSGETIPDSCYESFMQLANLDVRRTLYAQLKNMTNVGSAFKEIQLKIDDWSGADAERKQLADQWTEVFHLDDLEELIQFF